MEQHLRCTTRTRSGNMKHPAKGITAAVMATLALACMDVTSPSDEALELAEAFSTLPAGFTMTTNSFAANENVGGAFMPSLHRGPGGGHDGAGFGPGGHGLMGGVGPDFIGGIGFGRGFGHGPFGGLTLRGTCAFNSSSGRVECSDTRNGLTIMASASYKTVGGAIQQAPDST